MLAFIAVMSQLRTIARPDGRLTHLGLDYTAAERGFALAGITVAPATWTGVQTMEHAYCRALNER